MSNNRQGHSGYRQHGHISKESVAKIPDAMFPQEAFEIIRSGLCDKAQIL
jgi:hypothetical protein